MKLYEILDLQLNANREELEKQYKKLIFDVHPNRNTADVGQYLEINFAYEILRDKHKREFYDTFGDKSLKLLENDKEAFIWSRCLNKTNQVILLLALTTIYFNLMLLPICIYLRRSNFSYSLYILPCVLSSVFLFIPIYRAYKLINRLVVQVFNLLIFAVYGFIMTTEMLVICLYCNKRLNTTVSGCLLAVLECLSIGSWLYKARKIKEYNGYVYQPIVVGLNIYDGIFTKMKKYIVQAVFSTSIILSIVDHIPLFIRVPFPFIAIVMYFFSYDVCIYIKSVLCLPVILFGISFSLLTCGVDRFFVLIPLISLFIISIIMFKYLYRNLPTFKTKTKELYYEDLIRV